MRLLPEEHVQYLFKIRDAFLYYPKVIYDIGACVLHWTTRAKEVWPQSKFVAFEAMNATKFLYEEAGIDHACQVLSGIDGQEVDFWENVEHSGGNSLYRENPELSPLANELFSESHKRKVTTLTLDTVVSKYNFPKPDLIKMDVQGAELEILKGASKTLQSCNHLILELQHKNYNLGAPKAQEVINYLKSIGFVMIGTSMFCGSEQGIDGDYHFMRTSI